MLVITLLIWPLFFPFSLEAEAKPVPTKKGELLTIHGYYLLKLIIINTFMLFFFIRARGYKGKTETSSWKERYMFDLNSLNSPKLGNLFYFCYRYTLYTSLKIVL